MPHTLHKKLITDTLTSNEDESLINYPRLLKNSSYHLTKKIFPPIQRQITVIQRIALLTTICITLLFLALYLTQVSHIEMKVASLAREPILPKYVSVVRVVSDIIPRVIMSRKQMENIVRDFKSRKQRITSVCETIASKDSYLNATLTNIIVDTKHNVSWCPIYKAASSTWMNYFAVLRGILTDAIIDLVRRELVQVNNIVRQKFRHNADLKIYEKINETKKFLIVRHPLERLLSAYRDKLEHAKGREYYYKRFGRRIVFKYRQSNETRLEPTFEEFLRFIVKEKYFDEHWMPYYRACEPCIIHYDYILKFETLNRDQNFFIQDTNLSEYLYEKNYLRNINPRGTTTKEILDKYITKIPRSLLNKIYKIYENDYKLFNYSFL